MKTVIIARHRKYLYVKKNNDKNLPMYVLYTTDKAYRHIHTGEYIKYRTTIDPIVWEEISPKDCHLLPGDNPIRIKIRKANNQKNIHIWRTLPRSEP
jgi:hypothetical protein